MDFSIARSLLSTRTNPAIVSLCLLLIPKISSETSLHFDFKPSVSHMGVDGLRLRGDGLRLRGGATNSVVQQKPILKTSSSVVQIHPDEQKPDIHRVQSVLLINEVWHPRRSTKHS